ncbi:MAG TPA: ferritin-like domain-containing protein [Thermoanaerobaculia bacterium]|nr:ferritin-like domain-containing protein [Thermoanaerobaculia bacterium]
MRNVRRYLVSPPAPRVARKVLVGAEPPQLPDELSWHDYAVFLLHVAAEVEHALMVQYLYAAYSLGGAELGDVRHENARHWREVILGIAKEEMGHLITVQNILRLIGGPLHLEREDYPFRSDFYPFFFKLEPATKDSLAKYVVAEAPEEWLTTKEAKEIVERASKADEGRKILPVGTLYGKLIDLFKDRGALTADDFRDDTEPYQANWDEWGRGYGDGQRGNMGLESPKKTPHLLIMKTTDRHSVLDALHSIAKQGEAPTLDTGKSKPDEKSHFERFLKIYEAFPERNPPSRNIPTNPTTVQPQKGEAEETGSLACARITAPESLLWAHLFNVRYRKLLFTLKHALHVRAGDAVDRPTARGNLIAWTFGEMYNLRSIAGILVTLPLCEDGGDDRAAPPFEVAYTLTLPDWDSDKWRVQRDLIRASERIIHQLDHPEQPRRDYLRALLDHDRHELEVVETLLTAIEQQEANA